MTNVYLCKKQIYCFVTISDESSEIDLIPTTTNEYYIGTYNSKTLQLKLIRPDGRLCDVQLTIKQLQEYFKRIA